MRRAALWLCLLVSVGLARPDPPSVVLIVADDLGWRDLGCYGSEIHDTPRLDALAARGVLFTNAYANAPNCAPSRASLLTGLYAPRHGVYTVGSSARGRAEDRRLVPIENRTDLDPAFLTIAEALRASGYATGHFGKWHLGDDPRSQGFDVNAAGTAAGHPRSYFSPYDNPALADGPEGEHLTARITDEAIAFVRAHASRPFFAYVPYYAVHTPIQGRPDLVEKYRRRATSDPRVRPGYAAMVEGLDENVGRLLDAIAEADVAGSTVVVFLSDNGGHGVHTSNAPLRGSKGMLYEGGVRVPLIVAGAGVGRPGESEDAPVIASDLFATLLELCVAGAPGTGTGDGRSLAPLLDAPAGAEWQERPLFWHFPAYLEPYAREQGLWRQTPASAVRLGRFKLLRTYEQGAVELYDLEEDPGESVDLASSRPEEVARLLGVLDAWCEETGAPIPREHEPAFRPRR